MDRYGTVGAYALQKGFTYAVKSEEKEVLLSADSWFS